MRIACKALLLVGAVHRLPEFIARAFALAASGCPGPVCVVVPEEVAHGVHDFAPEEFTADAAHCAVPALRAAPIWRRRRGPPK